MGHTCNVGDALSQSAAAAAALLQFKATSHYSVSHFLEPYVVMTLAGRVDHVHACRSHKGQGQHSQPLLKALHPCKGAVEQPLGTWVGEPCSSVNTSSWLGIVCSYGSVASINLTGLSLQGMSCHAFS